MGILASSIVSAGFGLSMALLGYGVNTPQFWGMLFLWVSYGVISRLESRYASEGFLNQKKPLQK